MAGERSCSHELWFSKTIPRWDEGIPLGNGSLGALIWGGPRRLQFSLDREDLWDTTTKSRILEEEYSYPTMVRLVREGNIEELNRIFDEPYLHALPTKLPTGKLVFDFERDDNVRSRLVLERAEAELRIGERIRICSFLHAQKKVGMIRVNLPRDAFSFQLENPQFGIIGVDGEEEGEIDFGPSMFSLKKLVYPAPEIFAEEDTQFFTQQVGGGLSYGIFALARETEYGMEIAYTIAASIDGEQWQQQALCRLKEALSAGYEVLFLEHAAWWRQYWSRSGIHLPDQFLEKNWYLAQYFLGSCSRKGGYPMPLQGVWTADEGRLPPWKGDYHLDTNLQMSYYSYLKANHLEEGEVLIDFLLDRRERARAFARSFYHTRGLCLPSTMTLEGESLGGWGMYSLSPTNQLWLCQAMERHYRFTGDQRFLREQAYPYLKESAECILELLEEREGSYYLPISSSPEIHDNALEAFLVPNSNYDLSLMWYLFEALKRMALELENGEAGGWEEVLAHLPQLSVNKEGVLMLSPEEELLETHRHHSHAMAIHPLRLLPYEGEENCRIIDATVAKLERLGSGLWVGFTFAWMAEFYAIQKNGNGAARQLELFWRDYCSPNGFHLNGDYKKTGTSLWHYRPFTLEGNFCGADALQEMLLQCEDNKIELFPAVPEEWLEQRVSFDTFRAERGLLVSAALDQGKVVSLTLRPAFDGEVFVRRNEKTAALIHRMKGAIPVDEDWIGLKLQKECEYQFEC